MRSLLTTLALLLALSAVSAGVAPKKQNEQPKQDVPLSNNDNQYIPCKRQVSVIYDASTDVPPATFKALQEFIDNVMFVKFNNFERLVTAIYDSWLAVGNLGELHNLQDVQYYVNNTQQGNQPADIVSVFEMMAYDLEVGQLPVTIIFLVGKFDDNDAKAVASYAEQIKRNGVFLSMIGIQDAASFKAMDRVADYAFSFDLISGIPNEIQYIIHTANGCDI